MESEVVDIPSVHEGLPTGWRWLPLAEVADNLDNKRKPINAAERETRKGDVPYYGATGQVGWIDSHLLDEEVVLVGEDGAPFLEPGRAKAYMITGKSWVNNHAHILRARDGMPNAYLMHYLNILDYSPYVTGTTRLKLTKGAMNKIPVPVAPLPQQRRIVEAIELQLGRLDAAVARLQGAKARLKRYKQAVLKAAVEGGDWETVPLRDLIQEGRKIAYGVLKPGPHVADGVRFIKSGQVRDGEMDLTEDYRISKALDQEFHRTRLQGGEVLLNLVGASIGRSAVAPDELKGANVTRAIAVIPVLRAKARWVQLVLNTPYGQEHMLGKTGGNAQPVLNLAVVKDIPIPLPAEKEMEEVVARTREQLSATSEMETTLDAQLQQAVRLRQAVLKRAFEGRLG